MQVNYEVCEENFDPNSSFLMGIHKSILLYLNSKDISTLIDLFPCLKRALLKHFAELSPNSPANQ